MTLHYQSLADVSQRIQRQELRPTELADYMLQRIKYLDSSLHSYLTIACPRAQETARIAEEEIRRGLWRGPLHGVPIAIKDVIDTTFAPTTAGMAIRAEHVPVTNSPVVDRLENAGAVIIGKLATTEGVFIGHHADLKTPLNPRGEQFWTGVSSSGSGVATAAGLCFGSLGTDTGGSIRVPSSVNGLTGLKPTWGRVSRTGLFPLSPTMDHVGPMARSAEDAAILLSAIAGWDGTDPTSLRAPAPDYYADLAISVDGLRVGVDEDDLANIDAEVATAVGAAIRVLEQLGARIVSVKTPDPSTIMRGWSSICGSEAALAHRETYPDQAKRYGPELSGLLDLGLTVSGTDLAQALLDRQTFIGLTGALFDSIDLLATPTIPTKVPLAADVPSLLSDASLGFGRYTIPSNVTGQPSISFPSGFDSAGNPIGVQLTARHLAEQQLLNSAHAFQARTNWHTAWPEI